MIAEVVNRDGEPVIQIRGTAPGVGHVVHESGPITLDPKDPRTRMEIESCQRHSTVGFAELYDAIRVAQRNQHRKTAA